MDIAYIEHRAKETLRQQGSHPPTAFIEFQGIQRPVRLAMPPLPSDPSTKQQVFFESGRLVGRQYRSQRVRHVCLVLEAWASIFKQGVQLPFSPSSDPHRREILLILSLDALSSDLKQTAVVVELIRDKTNALVELRPADDLLPGNDEIEAVGGLLLRFLAGIAAGSPSRREYKKLLTHIQAQESRLAQILRGGPLI
jgi:hypothetical protein